MHEEVQRTTLREAAARYADGGARGEFVLVVEGAPEPEQEETVSLEDAARAVRELAEREGVSLSEAARRVAALTGLKKSAIYHAASASE